MHRRAADILGLRRPAPSVPPPHGARRHARRRPRRMCTSRTVRGTRYLVTSTDAGSTWQPARTLPTGTFGVIAAASAPTVAVATGAVLGAGTRKLLITTDGGTTWRTPPPTSSRSKRSELRGSALRPHGLDGGLPTPTASSPPPTAVRIGPSCLSGSWSPAYSLDRRGSAVPRRTVEIEPSTGPGGC